MFHRKMLTFILLSLRISVAARSSGEPASRTQLADIFALIFILEGSCYNKITKKQKPM